MHGRRHFLSALYRNNSKQIFLEMKLRGLIPNFYIRVSPENDLHVPTIGPQAIQQNRRTDRGNI
jgi:hypothetical protein